MIGKGIARGLLVAAFLGLGALAGAESPGPLPPSPPAPVEAAPPPDAMCPLMPWEPIKPSIFVDKDGVRTWFCCQKCKKDFLQGKPGLNAMAAALLGPPPEPPPPALVLLGRLHPAAAHFPIALLVAALLAELGFALAGRPGLRSASRFCVVLGGLAAPVAAGLGLVAATVGPAGSGGADVFELHRLAGLATAVLGPLALYLSEHAHRRGCGRAFVAYRGILVLVVASTLAAGYLGGELAHGAGHLGS